MAEEWARAGKALCRWYEKGHRQLPWRLTDDPYAVLVSEIMLQQTQAKTVCSRFEAFMKRFPDAQTLASAPEEELLKAWEGLGYYTRARNLKKAACCLQDSFGGRMPPDKETLMKLPGVGDYTASAVSAIAFHRPETAVDANAERIAARLCRCTADVKRGEGRERIRCILSRMLGKTDPAIFTQAVMELGQTVCTAKTARCGECPLLKWCRGKDDPGRYPAKAAPRERPTDRLTALYIGCCGRLALKKRPGKGLLAGMYGPLLYEGRPRQTEIADRVQKLGLMPEDVRPLKNWKHEFTHRIWDISGWLITVKEAGSRENLVWTTQKMLREEIAVPTAFSPGVQEWERIAWTES